jgi:hypothetical protein
LSGSDLGSYVELDPPKIAAWVRRRAMERPF